MNRDEAAFLLGLPIDANPDAIRQAWRMWARIAHPDVDGDTAHFVRLETARRVLLQSRPAPALVVTPTPRISWLQVIRRPTHPIPLFFVGIMSILLASLAGIPQVPFAVTVAACAMAAAAWAGWATREILTRNADHGHRIAALAICWLPIALARVLVSVVVAASFVPVLPLLAVPLIAVVASVNPGAGLWRPVGR